MKRCAVKSYSRDEKMRGIVGAVGGDGCALEDVSAIELTLGPPERERYRRNQELPLAGLLMYKGTMLRVDQPYDDRKKVLPIKSDRCGVLRVAVMGNKIAPGCRTLSWV